MYATLADNATVTISGQGDMWENTHMEEKDYKGIKQEWLEGKSLCPWFGEWKDDINEVVFADGVTNIGKNAFMVCSYTEQSNDGDEGSGDGMYHSYPVGLPYLSSVKIGSTIKSIDAGAFCKTKALKSIVIPGNVNKIGNYAFYRSGLTSIELSDGLEEIGEYAFANTELKSIDIPGTVKNISSKMFVNTELKNVTINDGTKLINSGSFEDVSATIYSKDVDIMEGAFGWRTFIKCYKGSTADKYAKEHDLNVEYLSENTDDDDEYSAGDDETKIYTEFINSKNDNWQAVYKAIKLKKRIYVKYGKLSIARVGSNLYIKKGKEEKTVKVKEDGVAKYYYFRNIFTNGSDLIYQSNREVYLWKNLDKKIKIATLRSDKDVLVALYGKEMYFQRYIGEDEFEVYKTNLETSVVEKTKMRNVNCFNGRYLVYNNGFHEYFINMPVRVLDMKTKKSFAIAKKVCTGFSTVIDNGNLYYTVHKESLNNGRGFGTYKIIRLNLKTHKKKVLQKNIKPAIRFSLDKNTFICYGEAGKKYNDRMFGKTYIYYLKTNKFKVI